MLYIKSLLNYFTKYLLLIFAIVFCNATYAVQELENIETGGVSNTVPRPINLNVNIDSLFSRDIYIVSDHLSSTILKENDISIFMRLNILGKGNYSNSEDLFKLGSYTMNSWGPTLGLSFALNELLSLGVALSYNIDKLHFTEHDTINKYKESVLLDKKGLSLFVTKASPKNQSNVLLNAIANLGIVSFTQELTTSVQESSSSNSSNSNASTSGNVKTNIEFSKWGLGISTLAGYRFVLNKSHSTSIDTILKLDFTALGSSSTQDQNALGTHQYKKYAENSQLFFNILPTVQLNPGDYYFNDNSKISCKMLLSWKLPVYKPNHADFVNLDNLTEEANKEANKQKLNDFFSASTGTLTEDLNVQYVYGDAFYANLGVTLKQNLGQKEYSWFPYLEAKLVF